MDALLAPEAPAGGKGAAAGAAGAGAKKPAGAGAGAGAKPAAGAGAGAAGAGAGSTALDFFKLLDSDTSVVNHLALLDPRGRTAADVRALELPLLAIVESVVRVDPGLWGHRVGAACVEDCAVMCVGCWRG
jgi:hypothetical protein